MINLFLLCCFSITEETNIMEKRCWISVGGPVTLFLKYAGVCMILGLVLIFEDYAGQFFLSGMVFLQQVLHIVWFTWEDSICLFAARIFPFTIFPFFLPYSCPLPASSWILISLNIVFAAPWKRRWDMTKQNLRKEM